MLQEHTSTNTLQRKCQCSIHRHIQTPEANGALQTHLLHLDAFTATRPDNTDEEFTALPTKAPWISVTWRWPTTDVAITQLSPATMKITTVQRNSLKRNSLFRTIHSHKFDAAILLKHHHHEEDSALIPHVDERRTVHPREFHFVSRQELGKPLFGFRCCCNLRSYGGPTEDGSCIPR